MDDVFASLRNRTCMVLAKGEHTYVICYTRGSEATFIATLMDLAEDDNCPLTWDEALATIRRLGL
jgi:c-di-GMP-binding flagellar brake protein YcgR